MTDYKKLVEALRFIGKEQDCNECEAGKWHRDINCCLFEDAADAIEALQAEAERLTKENRELYLDRPELEEIGGKWVWKEPKRGKIVRCKECIHFTQGGWGGREFDWFPVDEFDWFPVDEFDWFPVDEFDWFPVDENDFCSMAEKMEVQDGDT